MLGRTDRRRRHLFLIAIAVLAAVAVGVRLAYWQVLERDRLVALAREQLDRTLVEPSQRGTIYDRSGTVVLATTIYRDRLWATPATIDGERRRDVARELVRLLGLSGPPARRLQEALTGDAEYAVLADELTSSQSAAVRRGLESGELVGVGLDPVPVRSFPTPGGAPDTTLASLLLGFVNRDGEGQYGVEQRYQSLLAGTPRRVVARFDIAGRPIAASQQVIDPGVAGTDLRLTIDASLQLQFEQELYAVGVADRARSVSAVALDPYTGDVLAWATVPGYDANEFPQVATEDPSRFIDPVIASVYEPGSVFKMLLAQAALEGGTVTLETKVNDSGVLVVQGGRVFDADHAAMGMLTFADVVAYSRNVGAARVALELGPDLASSSAILYQTWVRMGFGRPTGVDVAGEVGGIVRDPSIQPWRELDLANGAFGQGVAVTPLQLASAYAAMANGGILHRPRVISAIGSDEMPPEAGERVISPELSAQLTGLMEHVVTGVPWYAEGTLIEGYLVGGKTGTAEIWDATINGGTGGYLSNTYNFSFVGYVGRERPEVIIAVLIHEAVPNAVRQGVLLQPIYVHELFRRLAANAMRTLDLPPVPVTAAGTPGSHAPASSPGLAHSPGASPAP